MKCSNSKRWIVTAVLLFIFRLWTPTAEAVTAAPVVHTHMQRDGSVIRYRLHGDEFLNYMTESGGSLVAFGGDGDLYLANWISEQDFNGASGISVSRVSGEAAAHSDTLPRFVVSTGQKPAANAVGSQNAPAENRTNSLDTRIPEYLLDYARQKRADRGMARREQSGNAAQNSTSFAPPADPGDGTKKRKILIIYVNFNDETGLEKYTGHAPKEEDLRKLIFDENTFGSIAHYYKTVTGGMAEIVPAEENYDTPNDGVVFVTLPGPHGFFSYNIDGPDGVKDNIIIPALEEAKQHVNFASFNTGSNPVLTADELSIGVMVHGGEAAILDSKSVPSIWAHTYAGIDDLSAGQGYKIRSYFAFGAFMDVPDSLDSSASPTLLTAGTIAHEMGHDAFGFVDVYDYGGEDGQVESIGSWSLMGSGNWGRKSFEDLPGSCPTPIDAYNLLYIKKPFEKSDAAAERFSLTNPWNIMKLNNNVKPSQYFLLQPRGYAGYDLGLLYEGGNWGVPQSGLLIYHIDEEMGKQYERSNDWNDHPLADIEEAHGGTQHLQVGSGNSGEPNDLFYESKNIFNGTTDPNSNLYESDSSAKQSAPSGINVYNITSAITNPGQETGEFTAAFDIDIIPVSQGGGGSGGCDTKTFASMGLGGLLLTLSLIKAASRKKNR
ncbi:MAG: immune inhibitor A [Synergistaceae bacterium]|jgi:M6 family metalloprotease-like protein|nr:immune inhibitor A [Synergistaceae bacterium]